MPTLNAADTRPLYIQLYQILQDRIAKGDWKNGDRLPAESQLAGMYGVSLITVRKAIGLLADKGILCRIQGKGTFVSSSEAQYTGGTFMGLVESNASEENEITWDVLECSPGTCFGNMLSMLGRPSNEGVFNFSRICYFNGQPAALEYYHFPITYAFLMDAELKKHDIFDVLRRRHGQTPVLAHSTAKLINASASEAQMLNIAYAVPLLQIRNKIVDASANAPIAIVTQLLNAKEFEFRL